MVPFAELFTKPKAWVIIMARIAKVAGFQIYVFSGDHAPPHAHVETDHASIRVAIEPPASYLSHKGLAGEREIWKAVKLVHRHGDACRAAWEG